MRGFTAGLRLAGGADGVDFGCAVRGDDACVVRDASRWPMSCPGVSSSSSESDTVRSWTSVSVASLSASRG